MSQALGVLLMLIALGNEVHSACEYRTQLVSGTSYYVYNPDYPNTSTGKSCKWVAQSNYRVKLTCGVFDLPASTDCTQSVVIVTGGQNNTKRYCGNGVFSTESEGNEMVIQYQSMFWSPPGKFLCLLQAIDEIQESDNCRCGYKNPMRIVGGSETGVNEFPMMAGLIDSRERQLYCGATIIAPYYVLTAAHCVIDRPIEALGVIIGEHDTTVGSDTNATKLLRAANYVIHPKYQSNKVAYDIAIVTVNSKIQYTGQVGPACLPFVHSRDSFVGSRVNILGWGTTEFTGPKSDVLLKTTVSVITNGACRKVYNDVTYSQICTLTPGHDACQFDSGGPVLWENPTTMKQVLAGIISFGGICGSNAPGVNTRVGEYIDWITFNTPNTAYCMNE